MYLRPTSIEIPNDWYAREFGTIQSAKGKYVNIGSGTWRHDAWTNLDLPAQTEAFAAIQAPHIPHDLTSTEPLPFEDASVRGIYCSHVVEHLPADTVARLFAEVARVIEPSGVFRISTGPCADLDWDALMRADEKWWFWFEESPLKSPSSEKPTIWDYWLYSVATPRSIFSPTPFREKIGGGGVERLLDSLGFDKASALNRVTEGLSFSSSYPGDHLSWWNAERLVSELKRSGFSKAFRSGYGQSVLPEMRDLRFFDQTYPQISVYVEAQL